MRVLERIVTDKGIDVADEIERLRDEPVELSQDREGYERMNQYEMVVLIVVIVMVASMIAIASSAAAAAAATRDQLPARDDAETRAAARRGQAAQGAARGDRADHGREGKQPRARDRAAAGTNRRPTGWSDPGTLVAILAAAVVGARHG